MPNDWQPTTPYNLPWGQLVEIRWSDHGNMLCKPGHDVDGTPLWREFRRFGSEYDIDGTEWRPINERVDEDGG